MQPRFITGVAAVTFLVMGSTTFAQTLAQPAAQAFRGYISVNGGYQATSTDFRDSITFTEFLEQGRIESSYSVEKGPVFDVAGAVRLWRYLGAGIAVTRFSRMGDASVAAQIAHPLYFDRPRSIEGGAADLKREELAVHIQAVAVIPTSERVSVAVFGGPSFFNLKQGLVRDVEYTQQYPYDTAALSTAETGTESDSKIGFNVGVDVAYYLGRNVGVGGVIRFSGASVDFTSGDGDSLTVDAGGFQAGGGLRLRF